MKALHDLEIFVRTADAGSISAAARSLDITPAAASAALKRLEEELGSQLFLRSTRSLRLTASGEAFLAYCRQALETLRIGQQQLSLGGDALHGSLRISAPSDLGRNILLPFLDQFMASYPDVRLRLQLADRLADMYQEPVDLALCYGELPDSGLVALSLTPASHRVTCAAPEYLARQGRPEKPDDLLSHSCMCTVQWGRVHDRWRFFRGDTPITVQVDPSRVANDGDVVRRWAVAGHGIAYLPYLDARDDLASGRLVALFPDLVGESATLYMLAPNRKLPRLVQRLRTALASHCENLLAPPL